MPVRHVKIYDGTGIIAFIIWSFILICLPIAAQEDPCFNSDFEQGDFSGWDGLTGEIDSIGNIVLDPASTFSFPNHTIKWDTTEFDPIALACGIEVPVVAPGGQYSLKLGDAWGGSNAEAIEKTITVGPENTYFNLRYAVILEDPDHSPEEQPRFKIDITDENGDLATCGSYLVVANDSIEGFQNCGDWRIRNWTTVTLELWSFLGQTVNIRFTTSDCSQGAHAGYAYIDGYCGALNIESEAFCEDATQVEFNTVPGLLSYEWSNGDTTYNTSISNPVPGDIYCVYVNGVTDCPVTICDTIPEISPVPELQFDLLNDTVVCNGSLLQLELSGENIVEAYWDDNPNGGNIFNTIPTNSNFYPYTVIGVDDCYEIHDSVFVGISLEPVFNPSQTQFLICPGDSITLTANTVNNNDEVRWLPGGQVSSTLTVSPDQTTNYTAIASDQWSCFTDSLFFDIAVNEPPELELTQSQLTVCSGELVQFQAVSTGTLVYNWSGLGTESELWLTIQEDTEITLFASTENGCELEPITVSVEALPIAAAEYSIEATPTCWGDSTQLSVQGSNFSEIIWNWNNEFISQDSIEIFSTTSNYVSFEVVSSNGCISLYDSVWMEIYPLPTYELNNDLTACFGDSLLLEIQLDSFALVSWEDFDNENSSQWILATENQNFNITITDEHNCQIIEESISLTIAEVPNFSIDLSANDVCIGTLVQLETTLATGINCQWFNSDNLPIDSWVTADSSAEFCAIAYNSLGCPTPTQCLVLNVVPSEAINYSTNDLQICHGESVELSIEGSNFNLLWMDEDDNNSYTANPAVHTPDSSGFYAFQVSDAFDCNVVYDSIWVEVYFPAEYQTSALQQMACLGESITLSITTNSQNQVHWLNQDLFSQEFTFELMSDTQIMVEIIDPMDCTTFTETFEVSLHETTPLAISSSNQQVCSGDSVSLWVNTEPGTEVYWGNIDLQGNEVHFVPDSSMTIQVSAVDLNGCPTETDEIFIEVLPMLTMIPNDLSSQICLGDSVMLDIEGENVGSVYWMEAGIEGPMMISPEASGFLSVLLTDQYNCQFMEVEYYVEVMEAQEIQLESINSPVCAGSWVEIEVVNAEMFDTYIWMDGSSSSSSHSFFIEEDFNFTLEALSTDACLSLPKEINIEMLELPEPIWTLEEASVCLGDSTELFLSTEEGVTVHWPDINQEGNSVWVSPEESQSYNFVLSDQMGCSSEPYEVFVKVLDLPVVELGEDRCIVDELVLNASFPEATYEWSTGETTSEITVDQTGLYQVDLQTKCGLVSDEIFVEIRQNVCFIKPPTAFSPNGDGLNDLFKPISNCSKDDYINYRFIVYSRWGDVMFESDDLNLGWDGTFQGKNMEIGVFVWYLHYEDQLCGTSVREKGDVTIIR